MKKFFELYWFVGFVFNNFATLLSLALCRCELCWCSLVHTEKTKGIANVHSNKAHYWHFSSSVNDCSQKYTTRKDAILTHFKNEKESKKKKYSRNEIVKIAIRGKCLSNTYLGMILETDFPTWTICICLSNITWNGNILQNVSVDIRPSAC